MNDTFWTDSLTRRDHSSQTQFEIISFRKISKLPLKTLSDVNHAAPFIYCCNVQLPSLLGHYLKSM